MEHYLDIPVRPLNVEFKRPAKRTAGKTLTALLYGDTHHGVHCEKTLSVVEAIGTDLQPDVLIDMGDGVDAIHLSDKFRSNPNNKTTLQDEIDAKRMQLARFRQAMPDARYIYLEGNHEERLKRAIWNAEGSAGALLSLNVVQKAMTWPTLLGLADMHIEFVPYDQQTENALLPKFLVKHGTIVSSKSGYTATREMTKYGRSGASGHTHRLGVVWHRDHNGQHVWVETGTCASLKPEYTQDPDWQNGCVILTFCKKTGAVSVTPVEIRNGHALWGRHIYTA